MTKLHIAIYLTDTWRDGSAKDFDNYAQMFETQLAPLMGDAEFYHFDVVNDQFPSDPTIYDAVIITGSSANIDDDAAWIEKLRSDILLLDEVQVKMFGSCFGHQLIIDTLGGKAEAQEPNIGAPEVKVYKNTKWMDKPPKDINVFAGNFYQATQLPKKMQAIASAKYCPNVMTVKQNHIFTLQYHPELSLDYMNVYLDAVKDKITDQQYTQAKNEFLSAKGADEVMGMIANFISAK